MNTKHMINRKAALIQSLADGKDIRHAVAPAEFLRLAALTDPLDFDRGVSALLDHTKADEGEFFGYQFDNECYAAALEVGRNTFFMDPVRAKINKYKYESGLLADDEILAFALFLVIDSMLVTEAQDSGELEFDDVANLINHVANRIKFILMCMHDGRYDVLNTIIQYVRKYKAEEVDTLYCFDTVTPDDGGVIDYFKAMTDHECYGEFYDNLCEERRLAYEARKSFEGFHADESPEDDDEDDCEDEYEEPLVERDFEG